MDAQASSADWIKTTSGLRNPPASLGDVHLPLPEKRGGRGAAAMETRPRPRAPSPSASIGRPLLPDLAAGPPLPAGR